MINNQVEFNPYIYTLSKLSCFGDKISVFNAQQGGIQNSPWLIRHGNPTRFTEEWLSRFSLCS